MHLLRCVTYRIAIVVSIGALFGGLAGAERLTGIGEIQGVVTDPTGALVPGGTVEIRQVNGAQWQSMKTDAQGRYRFGGLVPGRYALAAVADGLERVLRTDVVVLADAPVTVDFSLPVARATTFVEVTAHATDRPLSIETDPRTPRQPMPAHDGADYLKTIPGFSVIRKGGTDGDPVLRGMAGSRLGILLDGQSIYGGCGNRMDPPTAYAFPEAYDRITVLKGPQTVVHGPGNSAGVVLFERADVSPGVRAFASPTFGMFGRNDQAADLKAGWRRFYVRASATRSAMDDYEDGRGKPVHSQYERWSTDGAFGWTPDDMTRVEVSGALSDGKAAYADRTMDGARFARQNAGFRVERRSLSRVVQNVEVRGFYNYVDHVMDNYSLRTFTATSAMPGPSVSNPDRRTVGGRASSLLQFSSTTAVTVGVDWQSNRHAVRSTSNQQANPYEALGRVRDAFFDDIGVYGEVVQAFGLRQRIAAGGRVDRWAGRDDRRMVSLGMSGTAANPTSGLRRTEVLAGGFGRYEREIGGPAVTFFAGVGRSERSPDYWELVSKESVSSVSAFETRTEKTTQFDTGLLFRRGAVSGSVAMFANRLSDFILIQSGYQKAVASTGGTPSMGGMTMPTSRTSTITRNVDASSWGGEASGAWRVATRVTVDGSLAYVRGRNRTDDRPLAQLPPIESRLGLTWIGARWSLGGMARLAGAQTRYALNQGNVVGQDLGPTSAFAILSANGGWQIVRGVRLSAGVDNLLDATYAEFISRNGADVAGFTTTRRVNEPGRTMWLKLDLRR